MKVLIIGNGGREHALAWKVSKSKIVSDIYLARGNAGTSSFCKNIDIDATDIDSLLEFAIDKKIDLTIVGPEDSLCMGIVDKFKENGLKIFGPDKSCARFEKSKKFTKEFLEKYKIPTAKYKFFTCFDDAKESLKEFSYPLVIKADGLCLGKGVIICQNENEAISTLEDIFIKKIFKEEGSTVIIEEFLKGIEESLLCMVADNKLFPLETCKDHKQIYDGNKGPNTGGVGTYSPNNFSNKTKYNIEKILGKIEYGLSDSGFHYYGILFIGFMIDEDEPKVLEFNVRFGDPETETLMPRLKSDLISLIDKCLNKTLTREDIIWSDDYCLSLILVSDGYPSKYEKNKVISGIERVNNSLVFHNGTKIKDGYILSDGGRVLTICSKAKSLQEARKIAYDDCNRIYFENKYYRTDIGLN
ncbi:phosphoribosylamine--glycine ligase [Anaerococcus porci]|uniref:phosphoribosylamine--glycine ligase n=1 Tax=Anaerococcus porci TaxID=2652269 RepID=UPI002A74F48B|nr:phosphoribosylamine--glycine ligase [Anaerococcus porci]MDY3006680.1 phosphoribosylamine--glycine ligase [Anaerococcus porci]